MENAEKLSFADATFDAYTIVFGIRNVTDIPAALGEAHRVLKRGGRFYCMEFSSSEWPGFSDAYDAWARSVIPRIGKAVAGDEDSYRYLVESIRRFPKPPAFRAMVADAGFVRAAAEPMLGGLVDHPAAGRYDELHVWAPLAGAASDRHVTHLWRLLKWGRTLARHGALTGSSRTR